MEMVERLQLTRILVGNPRTRKAIICPLLAAFVLQSVAAISAPSASAQDFPAPMTMVQASQVRLSFDAGLAWRGNPCGDADGIMKANLPHMGRGYSFGMDVACFWSKEAGAGVLFRQFRADHGADVKLSGPEPGASRTGRVESHPVITFIGPAFTGLVPIRSRHLVSIQLGIGWMDYRDRGRVIEALTMTSSTPGCAGGLGYAYFPVPRLSLGTKFAFAATPLRVGVRDNGVLRDPAGSVEPLESPMFWTLSFTLSYLCF